MFNLCWSPTPEEKRRTMAHAMIGDVGTIPPEREIDVTIRENGKKVLAVKLRLTPAEILARDGFFGQYDQIHIKLDKSEFEVRAAELLNADSGSFSCRAEFELHDEATRSHKKTHGLVDGLVIEDIVTDGNIIYVTMSQTLNRNGDFVVAVGKKGEDKYLINLT